MTSDSDNKNYICFEGLHIHYHRLVLLYSLQISPLFEPQNIMVMVSTMKSFAQDSSTMKKSSVDIEVDRIIKLFDWLVWFRFMVFNATFNNISIWLSGPIICSDWLKFQRSSSLKLMNWLNPNCKWMIIGMFFTWSFLGSLVSIIQVVSEKKRFETFFP
jgi:hypothetical protein